MLNRHLYFLFILCFLVGPPLSGSEAVEGSVVSEAVEAAPDIESRDHAYDLEVSLTSYYQKYLGRVQPDIDAYQQHYPLWTFFFGVVPIPVFPMEVEDLAESIQNHMETGRFHGLPINAPLKPTVVAVAEYLEEVALVRASIEAAQEGRYNVDLKALDIYQHHLEAVRHSGFVYHLSFSDFVVLADSDFSRFIAHAEATISLYKVTMGSEPMGKPLKTIRVQGTGVSINLIQLMDSLNQRKETASQGAPGVLPNLSSPLLDLGMGTTLVGGIIGREVAMTKATRNLLVDLDVALSQVEGFRLEAPVVVRDGRKLSVNLGEFEGVDLDHNFGLWVVAPAGLEGCPEAYPDVPSPGACGKRVGYARIRDVGDNRSPDGGRLTPERDAISGHLGESVSVRNEPYFSDAQILIHQGLPEGVLGLKLYEERSKGKALSFMGGLSSPIGVGFQGSYRRSIVDLIPLSELSLETTVSLRSVTVPSAVLSLGPMKRMYVGRVGGYIGTRVGVGARLDDCTDCRLLGIDGAVGLDVLISPKWSLQAGVDLWRYQSLGDDLQVLSGVGLLAGGSILW